MITTLVFDIGNVLSHFSFDRIVAQTSPYTAKPTDLVKGVFVKWSHPFCLGELEPEASAKHCLDELEFTGSAEDLRNVYNSGFTPNAAMRPIIERYAKDYRLLYLSDTNAWHLEHLLEHDPLLPYFRCGTASFNARALKPDAAIYEHAVQEHGVSPKEAIFIDDRLPNVRGAEAVGFTGLHYELTQHGTFEKQLAEYLDSTAGRDLQ